MTLADSGYCSEKNLLYLKEHGVASYIKLQDHEQRKTRAYKEDIGKYYNMKYEVFEDEHYYICHDGRELRHIRTETREQDGYTQTFEVYGCADCSGCPHKEKCLYKYNAEKDSGKNKVMKVNERWEELKEESHANIQSEKGILNRQNRSIQTEGHFGDIKENEKFRRFHYRSTEKVYKEFMLYAIGRNIVSAKYFCGFSDLLVSSIIVGERYLDYFTIITEDRLWQLLAKPVFRWRNRSGLSMNAAKAA